MNNKNEKIMNKVIIIIIILFSITTYACTNGNANQSGIPEYGMVKDQFSIKDSKVGAHTDYKFTVFEYDGHEYLVTSYYTYKGAGVSTIHLESCKCKKNK